MKSLENQNVKLKLKRKPLIIAILLFLVLIVILFGTTYAVFSYTSLGTTDNIITSGTLRFLYTENNSGGRGINLTNAFPVSDEIGMQTVSSDAVFDFKVEGTVTGKANIPYEITVQKSSDSTLDEDIVKIYLVDTSDDVPSEFTVDSNGKTVTFSNLPQSAFANGNMEKTIYKGIISSNISEFLKNFRLRMWISEDADFSPTVDENGDSTQNYPYNGEVFKITVNVYANANITT